MLNQNEFIIKINGSLKEIDITNLKTCGSNAFILCKYSFINYEIYLNKFINKQLTKSEIQSINQNSPKFNFSFEEIMSFINKINIYIVDRNYLIHRCINQNFLNNSNLSYYIQNGIQYLFFCEKLKLFMILPEKVTKLSNSNKINNIKYEDINNFPNKEAKKILEKYANNNLLNKTTNNKIDEELDKLRKENIFLKKELKELKEDSSMNKSKIDN